MADAKGHMRLWLVTGFHRAGIYIPLGLRVRVGHVIRTLSAGGRAPLYHLDRMYTILHYVTASALNMPAEKPGLVGLIG